MQKYESTRKIIEILDLSKSPLKEEIIEMIIKYQKDESNEKEFPRVNFLHDEIIIISSFNKKISFKLLDKNIIMKQADIEKDTNTELTIITNDKSIQLIENHYINKQLQYMNTSVLNENGNLLVARFENGSTSYYKKTNIDYKRPITEVFNINITNGELITSNKEKTGNENNQLPKESFIKTYQ